MNTLIIVLIILAAVVIFNLLCVLILWLHFRNKNKEEQNEIETHYIYRH